MIKVTLNGQGGELDCRTFKPLDDEDAIQKQIKNAVQDIVLNCVLDIGDTIVIEEINS
jgi:hypothetical protein